MKQYKVTIANGEYHEVNNCDVEITEEAARIKVCEEFGFEASRVKIIGSAYEFHKRYCHKCPYGPERSH